jgi:hypothetical protein
MAKKKNTPTRKSNPAPSAKVPPITQKKKTATPTQRPNGSTAGFIIFLIAFVLYLPSLRYGYVLDDKIVFTQNTYVKMGFGGMAKILSTESFSGYFNEQKDILIGGRYRPLSLISFAIEQGLWGQNAALGHLLNVLLYALLGWLIYHTLRRIFPALVGGHWALGLAFLTSLLYILHPIHSEAVANIKGRDEILAALGAIGALYASWEYAKQKKMSWNILAGIWFFGGLLAKENALTFLAVIPLTLYFFSTTPLQARLANLAALSAAAVAYLLLRYWAVGHLLSGGEAEPNLLNDPYLGLSWAQKYASIVLSLGWYLRLLLFPHPLTHDYYPFQIPVVGWGDWRVILTLLAFVALAVIALRGWRSKSIATYSILFFVLTLSMVSNIFFNVGTTLNERFAFLPSLGFSLATAWLLVRFLPEKIQKNPENWNSLGGGMLVILLGGYFLKTQIRLPDWQDEYTLNEAAYKYSPQSARANLFMGVAIFNRDYATAQTAQEKLTLLAQISPMIDKSLQIIPSYNNAQDFKAGLAGERFVLDKQLSPLLQTFSEVAHQLPGSANMQRFLPWVAANNGNPAIFADFCYRTGYQYLAKEKQNYTEALKFIKYGLQAAPGNPQLTAAQAEVKRQAR